MISERMQNAINDQINAEMASAYLYLSMASYFESKSLSGFANWMRIQYEEEMFHAFKFFDYVVERGGRVILKQIDTPDSEWNSPVHVFEATLEHERLVTSLINKLVDLSIELKDHATNQMLQWFVEEQVEEESTAETILDELNLIGEAKSGLFMLNREMAQRTFTPPTE